MSNVPKMRSGRDGEREREKERANKLKANLCLL